MSDRAEQIKHEPDCVCWQCEKGERMKTIRKVCQQSSGWDAMLDALEAREKERDERRDEERRALEKEVARLREERVRMLAEFKLAREVEQERVIAAFKACGGPAGWSLVLAQLYSLAMLPAGMWRWEDSLGNFSIFDSAISFIPEPNRTYRRLVYADEAKPVT